MQHRCYTAPGVQVGGVDDRVRSRRFGERGSGRRLVLRGEGAGRGRDQGEAKHLRR